MKKPNIEDYKLAGGGYSQKYITDLEKYCNELEKANETMNKAGLSKMQPQAKDPIQ